MVVLCWCFLSVQLSLTHTPSHRSSSIHRPLRPSTQPQNSCCIDWELVVSPHQSSSTIVQYEQQQQQTTDNSQQQQTSVTPTSPHLTPIANSRPLGTCQLGMQRTTPTQLSSTCHSIAPLHSLTDTPHRAAATHNTTISRTLTYTPPLTANGNTSFVFLLASTTSRPYLYQQRTMIVS